MAIKYIQISTWIIHAHGQKQSTRMLKIDRRKAKTIRISRANFKFVCSKRQPISDLWLICLPHTKTMLKFVMLIRIEQFYKFNEHAKCAIERWQQDQKKLHNRFKSNHLTEMNFAAAAKKESQEFLLEWHILRVNQTKFNKSLRR